MSCINVSEGKVLIKAESFEAEVKSDIIIIPEVAKKTPPMQGIVAGVHKDEKVIKEGDRVLYARYGGEFFVIDDIKYLIIDRDAILAKVS